jgi:hypothetical protein
MNINEGVDLDQSYHTGGTNRSKESRIIQIVNVSVI